MTTEQPARENRPARRSSYGSDLAAPQQQVRQRAHSEPKQVQLRMTKYQKCFHGVMMFYLNNH